MNSPEKLFQSIAQKKWPKVFTIWGQEEYLHRELRNAIRAEGFNYQFKDMKKKGPDPEDEDLSCSTSLFQDRSFVWLQTQAAPDRWSADSKNIWERMISRSDEHSLIFCLQVTTAFQAAKKEKMDLGENYVFDVPPASYGIWLKRMNKFHQPPLEDHKLRFLEGLDASLSELDQYIELWSLGGDAWAEVALSFGAAPSAKLNLKSDANPAYEWVDALLMQNPQKALTCLSVLLEKGQDPLQLLGLVSKSLKIWAFLEKGINPQGEAPFLVEKVRRAMRQSSKGSGQQGCHKLSLAAKMDVLIKSRPVDASALLVQLSS